MAIVTVGIDLAKNVFAVHDADACGKAALVRPSVVRAKLLELIASLPPCLIGIASVFWSASLGASARRHGTHCATDGAQVCCTLSYVGQTGQE